MSAYVGSSKNLKDLKDLRKGVSLSQVGSILNLKDLKDRNPEAKMLSLQSFPRKGVSLSYVGRIKT